MKRDRGALWLLLPLLVACPPTLSRPHSDAHRDHLAQGEREMRHGRWDAAAEQYQRASAEADRRVDRDEALYRRSRALSRAGRWTDAVAVLDEIAAYRPPSRRTARAIFDGALLRAEHLDEMAAAVEAFERVVRQHSDEGPAARALKLWLEHIAGDSEQAALALAERLHGELGETDLADDLLMAQYHLHLSLGDRAGARQALGRLVRDHPYPQGHRWDDAILRLADMDMEDGRPRDAARRLQAMLERSETTTLVGSYTLPAFPEAQIRIARINRDHLNDLAVAQDAFESVIDDFPDSRLRDDAMVELGEMQLDAGRQRRGCRTLRRAVEEFEVGSARRRAAARLTSDCPD